MQATITRSLAKELWFSTLDFAAISRSALSIISSEIGSGAVTSPKIGSGAVTYGKIAANAVRTDQLYIEGDVNFAADGSIHKIHGVDTIYFGPNGLTSGVRVGRSASDDLMLTGAGMVYLEPAPNNPVKFNIGGTTLEFFEATSTGGAQGTAAGRVKVESNGIMRFLRLYTN